MRVFIYEFVTGGGAWSLGGSGELSQSLLKEGRAMAAAVTADFAKLPETEVWTTRDSRVAAFHDGACKVRVVNSKEGDQDAFPQRASESDWTVLIAPEFDGILLNLCQAVVEAGGRLLSPGPELVELCGNKQFTAEHLLERGIRIPTGKVIQPGQNPPTHLFPAIVKPLDGCGSGGVQGIGTLSDFVRLSFDRPMRLENFVPGIPASVSILCGPRGLWPLPACLQHLTGDGRFAYLGGQTPVAPHLDERAQRLALAAVQTLPDPIGWVGVDLVLGNDRDGAGDTVIEINPRLTTSYVGLRELCRENLAAAMLAVAQGIRPALSWYDGAIQFTADGRTGRLSQPIAGDAP